MSLGKKVDVILNKLIKIEGRLDKIEDKFNNINDQIDSLESKLTVTTESSVKT